MAGVNKATAVIIDIPALAREVAAKNAASHDVFGDAQAAMHEAEKAAETPGPSSVSCALCHDNNPEARFCATCGLPMDAELPGGAPHPDLPRPAAQLTQEELRERNAQHAAVLAANAQAEQAIADLAQQPDPSDTKLRIHFVSDGFTFAGRVWYVGDELEIGPEHPRWQQALPWIGLTKRQQVERYGKIFFDTGPWPYNHPAPGTELPLPAISTEQLFALKRGQGGGAPARPGDEGNLIPI